MKTGIYKIENVINHKVYIGQSIDITRRLARHRENMRSPKLNYPLYIDAQIFGIDHFTFDIIEECDINVLNEREKFWINKFNSFQEGYNQTQGGSGRAAIIKISNEDLLEIIHLLKTSSFSQNEIAYMFDIGIDTVSEINTGKTRIQPNETYPLRHQKKLNICQNCGKSIGLGGKTGLCPDCYYKSIRRAKRPEPLDLAKEIIANGFDATGKKYGISGNAIKKWCIAYNMPSLKKELFQWYELNKMGV